MTDGSEKNDRTQPHMVLARGTMVGHYRIIEKIGSGGMGELYLAEDTKLNRRVALKFLPVHLASDGELKERFKREAQAAAALDHPNIVTIYEVSEHRGRPFFAMQFVEGQSLKDYGGVRQLSIEDIIGLSIGIGDGLQEAHRTGIVHRDIKPANIIIDTNGRPRILDFGLATIGGGEQLTKTGSTLGTIGYMSPEQARGKEVDHRSDLFSFGVVLYELIAGRAPFKRDNEAATLEAILQDEPEPLARYRASVPDELERVVSKLLKKDPQLRYQSAAGLISDLKGLVISRETQAVAAMPKRSFAWPLAAGIAVIAAVVAIALISYWPAEQTPVSDVRKMLAVLPFENLGSPDDEYFADGITDEITSRVAVLDGLGVIARTSILQYKGTKKRISEIGAELNVDYILEGTIRWDKSGSVNKVRITPQLIRVSDETHLWVDNLQRDLSGIFEVQEEIATSIAEALDITLLTSAQEALDYRPTENLDAYDYYLRAMNFVRAGNQLRAIELLDKATELDSTFALAFTLKSVSHSIYAFFNESGFSEHTKPARLAYNRAFEIQPDLAEAHLARGVYLNFIERDYLSALEELELARQGHVDEASVLNAISMVKLRQGKWDEAIALGKQVMKLDPQSVMPWLATIQASWYAHQYDKALEDIERAISLRPEFAMAYSFKAQVQICMGADVEQIQQTLSEWSAKGTSPLAGIEGPMLLDFLLLRDQLPDLGALISGFKSALQYNPDPGWYFYTGLLYRYTGDEESSYLYLDSARIVIENRIEEARSDTSGRFEVFPLEHNVYEQLALVYSLTDRHEQATEQAQLAMESLPVEACHW